MVPTSPPEIHIRRSIATDFDDVVGLVTHTWSESNDESLPKETVEDLGSKNAIHGLIRNRMGEIWITECQGQLAAMLGADDKGFVWAIYVHPQFQRQGIGATLLTEVQAHFRAQALESMCLDILEANTAARRFYEAQGWTETSRREEHLPGHSATAIRYCMTL